MDSKIVSSIFEEALLKQHQQESQHQFTLEFGLFIALLFGSFLVGVTNLNYNTLFLDEAMYAVAGEDLLQGIFTRSAISFHFGSYLYPVISAILNKMGGVTALRLTSIFMLCLASVSIYFTTRKLFGHNASLFGMMLFSFSGVVLNLGQLAVYDSLALPFLAASLYFLVAAAKAERCQKYLLLAASVCAILSTLSKYIGLIYLPALFVTTLMLLELKGTSLRQALFPLFTYFIFPIVLVLSFYAVNNWHELIQVFKEQGFSPAPRWLILSIIGQNIGFVVLLAFAGLVVLIIALAYNRNNDTPLFFWNERSQLNWVARPRSYRVLFFVALMIIFLTWLAAPFEQFITGNGRSLWKNCAYSLVFFSPLAGYCLATYVVSLRSRNLAKNLITLLLLCGSIAYFSDQALESNWSFHQSWPNTQGLINYLRDSGLNEKSHVLGEGVDIYEYYFDFGTNDRQIWNSFWYMDYGGVSGQEGALNAIRDRALDFIIIDDYYFPGIRERVNPVLVEAGYVVDYQELQTLRSGGTIVLQVFVPGDRGSE